MLQIAVAVTVVGVAISIGLVLRRKQRIDAPTQPVFEAPAQLDRSDFPEATAPWMVAVFSSGACTTCADVVRKAMVLRSKAVSVVDVEYGVDTALHTKYHIDAVPIVVVADSDGVVRKNFVGPVTATDLWAAVADLRG
jgi:hypothetical protein